MNKDNLKIEIVRSEIVASIDYEKTIFELNNQIDILSSQADQFDYYVAIASGVVCAMLDILWVGEFGLKRGREITSEQVQGVVKKVANMFGCNTDDITEAVRFLEEKFPLAADGNTPDFGGSRQHHLRDFAHHPTIVGLIFSLITQFTGMSYGTNTLGQFMVVPVSERSMQYIGKDVPDKIFKGTVIWFFHLVSDVAGSSNSAGTTGGMGILGPILALAKEISALPFMKEVTVDEMSLSVFLSKLYNGTLFIQRDSDGKIIKGTEIRMDLRGELGAIEEIGRQSVPVIANDVIVRSFYFVRRFMMEAKNSAIQSISDLKDLDWDNIKPFGSPTVDRMLFVATGVFTTIDIADAAFVEKSWLSVNYVGVGRFTIALGAETLHFLKQRDVVIIRDMYETIERNTFNTTDMNVYERIADGMTLDKLGLTVEQTEILYNIEFYKTINDINGTSVPIIRDKVVALKSEWINEWKEYLEMGFSSFVQDDSAVLRWHTTIELKKS